MSDSLVFLSCFFKSVGSSSSNKFFSLILTALIVLLFIFNIESANAAVTAVFKDKCSWTSSDGETFSASNCHISLGRPTVYPCVLSNYAAAIDIIFPGGAHFEIVESCSELGSPYQVNRTAAFDCPAKIDGYRHNIYLMNGKIFQYDTPGGCC